MGELLLASVCVDLFALAIIPKDDQRQLQTRCAAPVHKPQISPPFVSVGVVA
jgi:hypothetical protein